MSDPVIATLTASPPRRWTGTAMLGLLGVLLVYRAFSVPFGVSQIVLILCGVGVIAAASRLYRATAQVIELTKTELRVKDGIVLTELSNIANVERGAFAFKPSNGFLVTTKQVGPRRWSPGMYWCFATRIGIGGATGAPQSKGLAETLSILIAEQDLKS